MGRNALREAGLPYPDAETTDDDLEALRAPRRARRTEQRAREEEEDDLEALRGPRRARCTEQRAHEEDDDDLDGLRAPRSASGNPSGAARRTVGALRAARTPGSCLAESAAWTSATHSSHADPSGSTPRSAGASSDEEHRCSRARGRGTRRVAALSPRSGSAGAASAAASGNPAVE